ncbi:MAG: MG2 domain-containing protein [Myxococcota bacterium]
MRLATTLMVAAGLVGSGLLAACGGVGDGRLDGPGPVTGHTEVLSSALEVDVTSVRGVVSGDALVVSMEVRRLVADSVVGVARVRVEDLAGVVLSEGASPFALKAASSTLEVSLPKAGLPAAGADEAGAVVRWELDVNGPNAIGYRSLLYVLPKADVQARLPGRLLVGASTQVRVFAVDPLTGARLPNTPVSLMLAPAPDAEEAGATADPIVVEAVTDEDGTAVLSVPAQPEEGSYVFTVGAGGSAYALALAESDVQLERSHRVLVTTDKPIYQPGQTMHLRALALRQPDLAAEAGRPLTFEVYDGKGNMVFRKYADTNDFGSAATDFKLASQVNEGNYQLKAILGETTTTRTVKVERYVLPRFRVSVSTDRDFYLVGDTIKGVVDTRYFFGKPVAGGAISVVGTSFDVDAQQFASLTGVTTADGLFAFEMKLPNYLVGQPLEGGNGQAALRVEVTDGAGHKEGADRTLVVADSPINMVAIAESGALVLGLENTVYLFATDPLNRPVEAALQATVAGEPVTIEALGTGLGRFSVMPEGEVSVVATAQVAGGVKATKTLVLGQGLGSAGGLLVRSDRALYRVGETVSVQVFSTGVGGRVFLDVIKDGQTMLTQTLPLVNGMATAQLDLDNGLLGDVLIEAYQVGADGAIERDKKLVFVADARGLEIAITPGAESYRPGEEATLTFDVKDASGAPVVAALGVQIVDEAVYALSDSKPGLLESYFMVQEALQTPQYQVAGFERPLAPILAGDPKSEVAQVTAAASLAALQEGASLGLVSSWAQVRAEVPSVTAPFHKADMEVAKARIQKLADDGELHGGNIESRIAEQSIFHDAWGNLYAMTVSWEWQGPRVTMVSAGPDEAIGTWDDWSGGWQVQLPIKTDGTGGAFPGGGDWANADAAGGPWPGGVPEANPGVPSEGEGGAEGPRVRKDFPETLYNNPALITGADGRASVSLTMADSITQWRVSALGNSKAGALGSKAGGIVVFQPFFVDIDFPASLTRGDEVSFPVSVFSYLDEAQTVSLTLSPGDWYETTGASTATVEIAPGQVTSVAFPVRVTKVGWHALTVTALGTTMSDAVQRVIRVVPDGTEVRESVSGVLEGTQSYPVSYPAGIIEGSGDLMLKIYPGVMAQAVEGLDSMLQMPSGCFEQTTATNWPNTLVVDYLRSSGQVSPEIELKAVDYLQQGYQRLLTFEVTGGGFVWFGDPSPANVILSAMGVLEFGDMARVIEVDPAVIKRTADWLLSAQAADGSWHSDQGSEFATVQYDDVKTTGFVAWALAESPHGAGAVTKALSWLAPHAAHVTTDVYSLAMMANAFAAAEPSSARTTALLKRLADLAVTDDSGAHWVYEGSSYNYYGPETSGVNATSIEVTGLAVQAFMAADAHLELVGSAVGWLAGNKDSLGNWGTTHATILTLRAMVRSLQNKAEEGAGTATVKVDGKVVHTLTISDENRNVFHQLDLGASVGAASSADVEVSYEGTGRLMTQLVSSYWMPSEAMPPVASNILDIAVTWDKTQLAVTDIATCTARVTNRTDAALKMVMVDLGVPPGFQVLTDRLEAQVKSGDIMKYELPGQQVTIYLEAIAPGAVVDLSFDVQARYPLAVQAPPSSAYLYYDTATRAETAPVGFVVSE